MAVLFLFDDGKNRCTRSTRLNAHWYTLAGRKEDSSHKTSPNRGSATYRAGIKKDSGAWNKLEKLGLEQPNGSILSRGYKRTTKHFNRRGVADCVTAVLEMYIMIFCDQFDGELAIQGYRGRATLRWHLRHNKLDSVRCAVGRLTRCTPSNR